MGDDSFAALFAAQSAEAQQQGHRKVHVGEMLQAIVVQIDKETIFVDLDAKHQAMLDVIEMRSPDGSLDIKVGDTIRARVVSVDADTGAVRLGRSFGKTGDITQIEQAKNAGVAIEGKVTGVNKGGIEVELGRGLRGFCPTSQIAQRGASVDVNALIGQVFLFHVTEIKDGGRNIVLSRRKSLEADAREGREATLRTLEVGKVVRGTVSAVRDFGAFVDLGGIEGLIPASEIAHERGTVASQITPGESVDVQVLEIKDDDKGQTRITLSLKALLAAPEKPAPKPGTALDIGAIVQGRVVRIESYGVFIQVNGTEGREGRGLIPSAELDAPRGADLRKAFPENTVLTAKILENGGGRLKLSVRGAREALERADFEAHKDKAAATASLGTFGDLLKKRVGSRGRR
jgi:small subunit ribosomal protein S1